MGNPTAKAEGRAGAGCRDGLVVRADERAPAPPTSDGMGTVRSVAPSPRGLRIDGAVDSTGMSGSVTIGPYGRIRPPGEAAGRRLDASGLRIESGFVDLQVNGGFGHLFTTDPDAIWPVGEGLVAHGVTAFLPTLISASVHEARAADAVLQAGPPDGWIGAIPLGLHLEGPALSLAHRGAHPAERLADPTPDLVGQWLELRSVRLVTLAPERPGALDATRRLTAAGVAVSVGHTGATVEEVRLAVDAGASMTTHLFNAMAPFHHREPGAVGAVLNDDRLAVGVIADGVHVHPEALAVIWRAAGPERIVLTGDVVAGLGQDLPAARRSDGVLAGGTTPFHHVRRTFLDATDSGPTQSKVTSTNACRVLACTDRGTLDIGNRADLVLLDAGGDPTLTIVGGRVACDPEGLLSRG